LSKFAWDGCGKKGGRSRSLIWGGAQVRYIDMREASNVERAYTCQGEKGGKKTRLCNTRRKGQIYKRRSESNALPQ